MRTSLAILLVILLCTATPDGMAVAAGRLSKASSCSLLRKKVAKLDSLPETGPPGAVWYCDFSSLSGNRWFFVALRANRACSGTCSNLVGWFAVNRRTGEIHSYDIVNLRMGSTL